MTRTRLLAMLLSLVSFSGSAEGLKESGLPQSGPAIRILGRWSDNSAYSEVRRQIVADWAHTHPEVSVEDQSVTQEDIFNDVFKTALRSFRPWSAGGLRDLRSILEEYVISC